MTAPLVVNTADGAVWTRREGSRGGEALYAPEKCGVCPQFVMVTLTELAELGIVGSADVLPMPVAPEPQASAGGYPPALPWAALMDDDDLTEFLDELADAATTNADAVTRLAEVERACGTGRLIAEAQHGHNTAPGPDAMTVESVQEPLRGRARLDASAAVAAEATHWKRLGIEEPEGEFYRVVHHDYRVGHDLPETGGVQ